MKNIILPLLIITCMLSCNSDDDFTENVTVNNLELDIENNNFVNYEIGDINNPSLNYNYFRIDDITSNIDTDINITINSLFVNDMDIDFDAYDIFLLGIKKNGESISTYPLSFTVNNSSMFNIHPINLTAMGIVSESDINNLTISFEEEGNYNIEIALSKKYSSTGTRIIYRAFVEIPFIITE